MTQDLTTENGVKKLMERSNSIQEWNSNCDAIKTANSGYPKFWYPLIVMSGLSSRVQARWARPPEVLSADGETAIEQINVNK